MEQPSAQWSAAMRWHSVLGSESALSSAHWVRRWGTSSRRVRSQPWFSCLLWRCWGEGVALCAYFGGLRPKKSWTQGLLQTKAGELLKYWWWPGLSFAATYYLVAAGCVIFLLKQPGMPTAYAMAGGGLVTGMMALYCYYLGFRRQVEEQQGQTMSSALLRCPFVMGILGKSTSAGVSVQAGSGSKV
jgi:hypothetical protein